MRQLLLFYLLKVFALIEFYEVIAARGIHTSTSLSKENDEIQNERKVNTRNSGFSPMIKTVIVMWFEVLNFKMVHFAHCSFVLCLFYFTRV